MKRRQYPRLMSTAVGTHPDTWKGVLYIYLEPDLDGNPVRLRLAECDHRHRNKRMALACADALAIADGAPRDVPG